MKEKIKYLYYDECYFSCLTDKSIWSVKISQKEDNKVNINYCWESLKNSDIISFKNEIYNMDELEGIKENLIKFNYEFIKRKIRGLDEW